MKTYTQTDVKTIRTIKANIVKCEASLERFMTQDLSDKNVRLAARKITNKIANLETKLSTFVKSIAA